MPAFDQIMLDVWREACRHIEIAQSARTIAQMLVAHLPIDRLLVRRIESQRQAVETVASGLANSDEAAVLERTERSPAQMKRLLAWCRRKELGGQDSDGSLAVPLEMNGEILIGPLQGEHGRAGVLVLRAKSGAHFRAEHARIAAALLEPFSIALENDHRLGELTALREAAEADKRSLLTRLGREDLGEMVIGAEAGLRPVMQRVELVAKSDIPVLILGETGSGKEVIARCIHNRSPRAGAPFIRVNCGAIPPELIDSELFGHEKGAFTGAAATRRGWFERADEGTLFLDEIGELPPQAQVRLLRVLQDGTFERVGGEAVMKVDVRIVAALAATQGRIEGPRGAAKLLGINPHTLRARMRNLNIDWARYRSNL